MKTRKGCWTCKARKLQCDGRLPTCERCARSQRPCQGYEMRLSWPRDNDRKRAIVGHDAPLLLRLHRLKGPAKRFFINTTWQDVEQYQHFALQAKRFHYSPCLYSRLREHPQHDTSPMDLVRHFYESAYLAIVSFDKITTEIRDSLLSLALTRESVPGSALLFALLAFTSLHRNGLQQQAVQLKISALHYLSASVKDGPLLSTEAAAQHVAASMLLGCYEILLPTESTGEWLFHVWGAMDMIRASELGNASSGHDEFGYLLDWVYYHEALSRFAVRHWRHKSLALETSDSKSSRDLDLQYPSLIKHRPVPPCPNTTFSILNLLSEICATLINPRDPGSRDPAYLNRVKTFEGQLEQTTPTSLSEPTTSSKGDMGVELYQLATRVYLARATQSPWETPTSLDALTRAVFDSTLVTCRSCEHFFPLFILACEARRDEDRAAVLSLIERTGRNSPRGVRSVGWVRGAVQSVWVQQDLHAEGEVVVDYVGLVSTVISASNSIPSFV
ncbi:fungal-specific transcription factor domain-containing protein [Apiospora arundinis]|uniref:Fungal-specific transcription factor domain-containing protein n=1 Tax=Apiospora arundinis TaxID=335852 RepID=A0ABR2J424_9PEZI